MHSPSASKFSPPLLGQGRERQLVSHVTPSRAIPRPDGHSPRARVCVCLRACVSAVGRDSPVARIYEITWFPLPSFSWMPFLPSLDRRSPATNSPNLRPFLPAVSPPRYQPPGKGFSLSHRVPNCCLLLRRPNDLPTGRLAERISLSRKTRFVAKADRENARVANANERGLETGGI